MDQQSLSTKETILVSPCRELPFSSQESGLQQWLGIRKDAALKIDPATAETRWSYGMIMDPYGIDLNPPDDRKLIGRVYFARAPGSDVWVSFDDLGETVRAALWERMERDPSQHPRDVSVTNGEIVSLAALFSKIMSSSDDEISLEELDAYADGISRLNDAGVIPVMLAARNLIEGKRYAATSDNPQTITRLLSVAAYMGASVAELRTEDSFARIVIDPPSRN